MVLARDGSQTQCCIVGAGPAGAMLALLLVRLGLDVVLLEKHSDFLRDFRGDDISPATIETLDELGLADDFLLLRPRLVSFVEARSTTGATIRVADLSLLRTRFPYIAVLPQWDFLNFLTREASRYPGFRLLMGAEATDLLEQDGVITGIRYSASGTSHELRATLTVAADGRGSTVRDLAGLTMAMSGSPIDLLWFRLPLPPGTPEESAITIHTGHGHAIARINRGHYWQVACVIPKNSAEKHRAEGIEAFRNTVLKVVPDLEGPLQALQSWEQISLLSIQQNRLRSWYRNGLLCLGDAAHAMSPIGGVGINFAIQDAVAAANRLADPIRRGRVTRRQLAAVQRRRAWQVWLMQLMQARLTDGVLLASDEATRSTTAAGRRLAGILVNQRWFLKFRSHVIAFGFQRSHVKSERSWVPKNDGAAV